MIAETRLPLDMSGTHAVITRRRSDDNSVELTLEPPVGDKRSIVHAAFMKQLRVNASGLLHRFVDGDSSPHAKPIIVTDTTAEMLLVDEDETRPPLSMSSLDVSMMSWRRGYRLSPFELRYAADTGRIHSIPIAARIPPHRIRAPITDLHSHFAGCVRGDELVRLGAEQGIIYPSALIEEAKIHLEGDVPIAELTPPMRDRLARRLEVPIDRRITFLDMEQIYRLRAPFTKASSMLVPLCREIAADYAAMGVEYVELSLGDIVDTQVLRTIHEEMPKIEEETGVMVRFLAAISRHDDPEWDDDLIERIKRLSGSVYIVGVDFMGHETNSTHAFAPVLKALATWADDKRPGFVIRVHAGESPAHPENVRIAIEQARGHKVELRIGHGLYGVDDATLEQIIDMNAIVEFNLDSNVALNHLQSARNVPIRRYSDAGATILLGSDGYGLYQTSRFAAAQAALLCGLDPLYLETTLAKNEKKIIERAKKRDAERLRAARSYIIPHDTRPVHFKPAVIAKRRAKIAERDAALATRLRELETPVVTASDGDAFRRIVLRRAVVSIAGAWSKSFEALPEAHRKTIERVMTEFVTGLDPREAVLVTGGTTLGVEGIVGREAVKRGLTVVAAIVRETPPAFLEKGSFTHACFVGETLYDKAAGLYELARAHEATCIFVGGGQIVADEIQTARNLRLRYLLMDGIEGASVRRAAVDPARAFRHASEALHVLRSWRTLPVEQVPHWFEGPNPTVDAVVIRDVGTQPRDPKLEVLLVLRDVDAPAEAGKWALPGGFVATSERRGGKWKLTTESEVDACAREIFEETGLTIDPARLIHLDIYEGGGRDPRDTATSWSRSTAFIAVLRPSEAKRAIAGGDDAADARWFSVDAFPRELAFDHAQILEDALATVDVSGSGTVNVQRLSSMPPPLPPKRSK